MRSTFLPFLFLFTALPSFSQEIPSPPPPPLPERPIEVVDEYAEFPGGRAALTHYLQTNLIYPQKALKKGLQGKCFVKFEVGINGDVSNVTIVKKVPDCPECDAEAARVVKAMPQWVPAKIDGKPVRSVFNLPITFKIAN